MGVNRRNKENLINCSSSSSIDPVQWQKIFNALVQMLQSQQSQLETLAKDRKLLEDRIQIQYQRWLSDVRLLEDHICQLKDNCKEAEMDCMLEVAKSDLVVGMKRREACLYKSISERSAGDLEDMKQALDCLSRKLSAQEDKSEEKTDRSKGKDGSLSTAGNSNEEGKRTRMLREEIRKLKQTNEKLGSQRNSEVSALVAERNFVWNQFKKMESEYSSLLRSKRVEAEQANENIVKLQSIVEQLQSSTKEKDDIIMKLNGEIAQLQTDLGTRDKELSRLSKESELISSSAKASPKPKPKPKPVPTHSSLSKCSMTSANNGGKEKQTPATREPTESQASGPSTGSKRNSKRRIEVMSKLETPRLFTSGFKVPKLKISSLPTL